MSRTLHAPARDRQRPADRSASPQTASAAPPLAPAPPTAPRTAPPTAPTTAPRTSGRISPASLPRRPASPPPSALPAPAAPAAEPESHRIGADGGVVPSAEAIAARAYLIYTRRRDSGAPGDATTDWLDAERELRHERSRAELLLSGDDE